MNDEVKMDTARDRDLHARLLKLQSAWLKERGLLDRPWFILGAAPEPALPERLPPNTAHIHVKYSGHSARRHGLPAGDLTFLTHKATPGHLKGLEIRNVLRLRRRLPRLAAMARWFGVAGSSEATITHTERDRLVLQTLGSLFASGGGDKRPSNGVVLISYAIAVGIPQIIVAGLSVDRDGHDYNPNAKPRRHKEEDKAALREIARLAPQVVTTEADLAEATGLALYRP
ncbi:hypothetical protein [Jiella pacifica]|uniref:Uncharacterized protein n=1 Tax=Jiella pacifica TaxID=2696469 RepID=A0A6N9T548_9HYPH|nr:hypothetical protein [Jiella pacifica]NDW06411.1 hypothetical protein [Jiella pacifica]